MRNGIFKLDWASIGDSILMAAITALVVGLVQLVGSAGFSLFSADWVTIGKNMLDMGFTAAVITLGQYFISTNSGSILGIGAENKPTV